MSLRNVFDQYDQAENKLTHALMSALHYDSKLIRPFLGFLKVNNIPPLKDINIGVQSLPGQDQSSNHKKHDSVPDAYFCDNESWAVIIESKVQARILNNQLRRHQRKANNYGYDDNVVIVISVNPPKRRLSGVIYVTWKSVYKWFVARIEKSSWARHFVNYMEIYESKMLAQDYNIKGTITMFSGFHFSKEVPYTYREGKRQIKVLGEEFRKNKRLIKGLGIDPEGDGRPAITRGGDGAVWDFIPLKFAKGVAFTSYPHATFGIGSKVSIIAITVPHGIKGGFKNKLKNIGVDGFKDLLERVEKNLRRPVKKAPGTKPLVYVIQRHYKSQRSSPETDGRIEVDLRTLVDIPNSTMKHQPMWAEAMYSILINKKTNIQFGIEPRFPYTAKCMRSEKAIEVMIDAWIAMKPLIEFARG